MNKLRPSERLVRFLAFSLCFLLYAGGGTAGYFWGRGLPEEEASSMHVNAVNLSFAQMELVAVEEPPPPKEPDLSSEALAKEEPLPPEEVDIALEEILEEPEPEPVEANAQVSQEAATPSLVVEKDALTAWVREQIEKEKYYPPTARRAGYEGTFNLWVKITTDGTISEAFVLSGKGHPLLRRSLEKIMGKLPGRSFGQPLGDVFEIPFRFDFDLQ